MPWSGPTFTRTNGTYSGASVWASDLAANIKIVASRHDTHDQDLATGINACLNKNGLNSPTANINWGGFKITNLAAGAAASDALRYDQAIGVFQASSAILTSIDGLTIVADTGIYGNGVDNFGEYTLTAGGRALGGVAGTADTFPYFSASNTVTLGSITTAGRALLDDANAAAQLVTIGAQSRSPAIQTVVSAATVTPTFSDDEVIVTAQAAALALANPTGTAIDGLGIVIRIKDNGTARAITFDTQYRAIGVTLPTTTVISKVLYIGMIYNATETKWDVVSVVQQA